MSVSCVIHRGCLEDVKEARTAPSNLAKGLSLCPQANACLCFRGEQVSAALSHSLSVTTARKTTPRPTALARSQEQHPGTATTGHCSPADEAAKTKPKM